MKVPSNCDVVYAKSVDRNKIVVVMKSKCRHFSSVVLEVENDDNNQSTFFVTDVKNRCGIKKAMSKVL